MAERDTLLLNGGGGINHDEAPHVVGRKPRVKMADTSLYGAKKHGMKPQNGGASGSDGPIIPLTKAPLCKPLSTRCIACIMVVSAILTTLSMVLLLTFDVIVRAVIDDKVAVSSSDSMLYSGWINPMNDGVDILREFTMYNLTNPFDVVEHGAVPNFIERGPFVYHELRVKNASSVQFFDNGTVGYTYSTTFQFDPLLSIDAQTGDQLSDRDKLVLLNAPLSGLTHRLALLPEWIGEIDGVWIIKQDCCWLLDMEVNATLGPQGFFVERSPFELLWGYEDPIWAMVHPVLTMLNYTAGRYFRTEFNGSLTVPSPYSFRSGQMCPLWDTAEACNGTANLYTIENQQGGDIMQWAGQRLLWWWGDPKDGYDAGEEQMPLPAIGVPDYNVGDYDPTCHDISGSDGMRFQPGVDSGAPLTMFMDMVFRSMSLVFWHDSSVQDIDTLRFALDPAALDNTSADNQRCYQSELYGVMNFERPFFGPAYATKSHMLDAQLNDTLANFTMSRPLSCLRYDEPTTPPGGRSIGGGSGGGAAAKCAEWNYSAPVNVLAYLEQQYGRDSAPAAFRERFESFLDVNALTGITLAGSAQGTAFTNLKPIEVDGCYDLFQRWANVTRTMYPLVTIKRGTTVSYEYAGKLRLAITLLAVARYSLYVITALIVLALFVSMFFVVRRLSDPNAPSSKHTRSSTVGV